MREWPGLPGRRTAISENLQATNIVIVGHENRDKCCVRVRLDAKDKVGSWARRVVDHSGIGGSPIVGFSSDKLVLFEPQEPRHCRDQSFLYHFALHGIFVQDIPAYTCMLGTFNTEYSEN
jgi:hypothetical protein